MFNAKECSLLFYVSSSPGPLMQILIKPKTRSIRLCFTAKDTKGLSQLETENSGPLTSYYLTPSTPQACRLSQVTLKQGFWFVMEPQDRQPACGSQHEGAETRVNQAPAGEWAKTPLSPLACESILTRVTPYRAVDQWLVDFVCYYLSILMQESRLCTLVCALSVRRTE